MLKVIKEEFYKIVIKDKIYIIAIILFLIKFILIMNSGNGVSMGGIDDKDYMDIYIDVISEGKQAVNELLKEYEDKSVKISEVFDKYEKHDISYKEYNKVILENESYFKIDKIYQKLIKQKEYVDKNPKRDYVNQNGWKAFQNTFRMDIVLLLILICNVSSVLCKEYDTEMHIINQVSCKGKNQLFWTKVLVALVINFISVAIYIGIVLGACEYRYGLGYYKSSVQSLYMYEMSSWDFTIGEMVMLLSAELLVLAFIVTAIVFLLSVFFKNNVVVLIGSICIVYLPTILFSEKMLMKIPNASIYIYAQGILRGIDGFQEEICKNPKEYMIKTIILACICFVFAFLLYKGLSFKKAISSLKKRRTIKIISMVVIVGFCINGCGTEVNNSFSYDACGLGMLQRNGESNVVTEEEAKKIIETTGVDFKDEAIGLSAFSMNEDELIYVLSEGKVNSIYGINVNGGKPKKYYSNTITEDDGINYLGLRDKIQQNGDLSYGECFAECWRQNGQIYYREGENIFRVNSKHNVEKIIDDFEDGLCAVNNKIYYVNNKMNLVSQRVDDVGADSKELIDDEIIGRIASCKNKIIYSRNGEEFVLIDEEMSSKKIFKISKICESCKNLSNAKNYEILLQSLSENSFYCLCNKGWFKVNLETGRVEEYNKEDDIMELKSDLKGEKVYKIKASDVDK